MDNKKIHVLFCCMGNICRSPTAHGVFRQLVTDAGYANVIDIESAGTHAYHTGEPPDSRAQSAAHQRGLDISDLRARQIKSGDFEVFDYILAMDYCNHDILTSQCPTQHRHKLHMFLEYAPNTSHRQVPDPYYGGTDGFHHVLDMIECGAHGLLDDIIARYSLGDQQPAESD